MSEFYPRPDSVKEMFAKRPYAEVGESELLPELMGILGTFPLTRHCSYMRGQMAATHATQIQTIDGSEMPPIMSGLEREYGKTTTSITSPDVDVRFLRIIHRYNTAGGGAGSSIVENPESWLLYEEVETHRLGVIELPRYYSHHTLFMHKFRPETQTLHRILSRTDPIIKANTILYRSPNLDENRDYKIGGVNLNAVFLSDPVIAEDGIAISESAVKKFTYKKKTVVAFSFGFDRFPANVYGTVDEYKPFPDIGDTVREDGLVCALVPYNPVYACVQQNIYGLMQPDFNSDMEPRYVQPGGKVVNINIIADLTSKHRGLPDGMERNFSKYVNAEKRGLRELWQAYTQIRSLNKSVEVTPELAVLLRDAYAKLQATGEPIGDTRTKTGKAFRYKDERLDQYRVEITIEHEIVPFEAHKFSNFHASKGVMVKKVKDEDMPVDEYGNRAEIILSPNSVANRKNPSILFELTLNAVSRDVANRVRDMLEPGWPYGKLMTKKEAEDCLNNLLRNSPQTPKEVNDYVMEFFRDVAPMHWLDLKNGNHGLTEDEFVYQNLLYIMTECDKFIPLKIPTNDPVKGNERARLLVKKYGSVRTPVTYMGLDGVPVKTKAKVRVGVVHTFMLEKITTDTYGAQNLGRPQIHGVLSNPTGVSRQHLPYRANSTKMTGELEVQMMTHYGSPLGVIELSDMSNNPNLFGHMANNIMMAENPSQMDSFIDRKVYKYGQSLLRNRVEHIFGAMGIALKWAPYKQEPKPEGFMENAPLTSILTYEPLDFGDEVKEMFLKTRYEN